MKDSGTSSGDSLDRRDAIARDDALFYSGRSETIRAKLNIVRRTKRRGIRTARVYMYVYVSLYEPLANRRAPIF